MSRFYSLFSPATTALIVVGHGTCDLLSGCAGLGTLRARWILISLLEKQRTFSASFQAHLDCGTKKYFNGRTVPSRYMSKKIWICTNALACSRVCVFVWTSKYIYWLEEENQSRHPWKSANRVRILHTAPYVRLPLKSLEKAWIHFSMHSVPPLYNLTTCLVREVIKQASEYLSKSIFHNYRIW